MSPSVRHIRYNELQDLLALYRQLHPDDPPVEQDKVTTNRIMIGPHKEQSGQTAADRWSWL